MSVPGTESRAGPPGALGAGKSRVLAAGSPWNNRDP